MNRIHSLFFTIVLATASAPAAADLHLELSGNITTTTVLDNSFEFFSNEYMVLDSYGADIRLEVAQIKNIVGLLPFLSYRYGDSFGAPVVADGYMDTALTVHDIDAGLRARMWFLSWLGAYAQLSTGISHIRMEADLPTNGETGMRSEYLDKKNKWNMGGAIGLEVRISPAVLKRANIHRLNLGGEIGIGFMKRMKTDFTPSLKGGDDYSLTAVHTTNMGTIDISGVAFQCGLILHFF